MNIRKWIAIVTSILLAALITLVLVTGLSQAQETGPERNSEDVDAGENAVSGKIPVQGQLTDDSGNPIPDGDYSIKFALYDAAVGGIEVCADTNIVSVVGGLFYSEIWGTCTSLVIDGRELYLSINVEDDGEMTPRQPILPVPYAFSLKPGAIISATTSNALIHLENWHSDGRGLRAYAMDTSGTNYGVVGASRSPAGYGGYFYNNGGGTALYGAALDLTGGIGVEGKSEAGSAMYGNSTSGYGIYGQTGNVSNNYGLFTPDNLYSLNYHTSGAMMHIVQNGGQVPLEQGDVVAFSGINAPIDAGGLPVILVSEITSENSTAIAGVVYGRFDIKAVSESADQVNSLADLDFIQEGPVLPGEYLLIVVQGLAQVKVSALAGSIQTGDLLSSTSQVGYAGRAPEMMFGDVLAPMPGTVLGKALEPLDKGESLIFAFITIQ